MDAQDKAHELYQSGRISSREYESFILFEKNELGKKYFDDMVRSLVFEIPPVQNDVCFAWECGRQAVFREIKMMIDRVYKLINGDPNV